MNNCLKVKKINCKVKFGLVNKFYMQVKPCTGMQAEMGKTNFSWK